MGNLMPELAIMTLAECSLLAVAAILATPLTVVVLFARDLVDALRSSTR